MKKIIILSMAVIFCLTSCLNLMLLSQTNVTTTTTTVSQGKLRVAEPQVHCWYDNTTDRLMMEITCETEGAKITYSVTGQNTYNPVVNEYTSPFTPQNVKYSIIADKDGYTNAGIRYTPPSMILDVAITPARYKYDDKSFLMTLNCESDVSVDITYTISDRSSDRVTPHSQSYFQNKALYLCADGIEREGVTVPNGKWFGYMAYKKDYKYTGITRYQMPWKGKLQGRITLTYKGLQKTVSQDYSEVRSFVYTAEYDGSVTDISFCYAPAGDNPLTQQRYELHLTAQTFYADSSYQTVTGLSGGLGSTISIIAFGEGYEDSDPAEVSDDHIKLSVPNMFNFEYGWTLNSDNSCSGSLTRVNYSDNGSVVGHLYYDTQINSDKTLTNRASNNSKITAKRFKMRLQYRSSDGNTKYIDSAIKEFSAVARGIDPGELCDWQ